MKLDLIAVGRRSPAWVTDGVATYTQRMPAHLAVNVKTVDSGEARRSGDIERAQRQEAKALFTSAGRARCIALDERGRSWSSADVARFLDDALSRGEDLAFLIGGADGLHAQVVERAERRWSLSALTLPHMLVRVVVAEQLYRAWTLLAGHPYHRD